MQERQLTVANVHLWDSLVGSVTWDHSQQLGHFTYASDFLHHDLDLAPMTIPLNRGRFAFPELNANVFKGLPGFLADSLPDKFGAAVINAWLEQQGCAPDSLNPVECLCLIGNKGMGALEYSPSLIDSHVRDDQPLDLPALVELINIILSGDTDRTRPPATNERLVAAMQTLLHIGVSADGSRAKAVVTYNPATEELRCGHGSAGKGFSHWLIKFDGITGNRDREAADPQGWGQVEYAYYLMARAAGINMMESRLVEDSGRRHFITRRFDRTDEGAKIHRQSLCAMGHMDFDAVGTYSYEEVLQIMRDLDLPQSAAEALFRRMTFNVMARNHDDHAKNIAFLMDSDGRWSLAPAYDLTFAYNPTGQWTSQHQMTINGKRDKFRLADLINVAKRFDIAETMAIEICEEVHQAVGRWPSFAEQAQVKPDLAEAIGEDLRLNIL